MAATTATPELVLLPGMNCSARLWGPVGDGAVHAELDRPDLDEQVDALLDVLPDRFVLGGLSLGAIVAMALTRRAPERVAGLCLMATGARPPAAEQRAGWAEQIARLDAGAAARDLQPVELLVRDRRRDAEVLEMADEVGEGRLVAQLRLQGTRIDERPALASVAVPTLVLAGAEDRISPVERLSEIASLVPGAALEVLPDAGHLITVDAPAAVAALVGGWLREVRAADDG